MNEEKIREVFSDEEFVKSFCDMETPEEAQAALAEKGIDVTVDELITLSKLLKKKADGELTDDDLASVAGGSAIVAGVAMFVWAAVGTAIAGYTLGHMIGWGETQRQKKA